jgi:hypothetical protein
MATSGRRQEGSVGDLSKAQAHRPEILCPHRSQQIRPGDESTERVERALRGAKRQWGQLADLDLLPPQTVYVARHSPACFRLRKGRLAERTLTSIGIDHTAALPSSLDQISAFWPGSSRVSVKRPHPGPEGG